MASHSKLILSCACFLVVTQSNLFGEDWPHWRGPGRNDISSESSGFKNGKWKLTKAWQANLGEGSSSPVIVKNQLFSFFYQKGHEVLECRNASTGKVNWIKSYPAKRYGRLATGDQGLFSGPCSTPEYDTQTSLIYTLGSDGDLICWNVNQQGKQVWRNSLHEAYSIQRRPKVGRSGLRDYGYTSSPLVLGDLLIVEVGAKSGSIIAFEKATGKEVWKSESNSPAGHNGGPVPITIEGKQCIAVHNHDGLLVVRTDQGFEGKTVAEVDWVTSFSNNTSTVAVVGSRLLMTSGYNQNRIACFQMSLGGARKIWEQKHVSKVCSPVVDHGKVYFCWRSIKCLDLTTGKLVWEGESTGDAGSMILTSDKKLIVWAKRGDLMLIDSAVGSPSRFSVLAKQRVFSQTDAWPHVVLCNGRLYCKDRKGNFQVFTIQ